MPPRAKPDPAKPDRATSDCAEPDSAVVYVPAALTDPDAFAAAAAPCLERVEACGYRFAGLVRKWPDVQQMLDGGQLHVLVVQSMGHLPRDRRPRVETVGDPVVPVAAEQCVVPPAVTATQRQRRPRRVW